MWSIVSFRNRFFHKLVWCFCASLWGIDKENSGICMIALFNEWKEFEKNGFTIINDLVQNHFSGPYAIQHLEHSIYRTSIGCLYHGFVPFIPVGETPWDGTTDNFPHKMVVNQWWMSCIWIWCQFHFLWHWFFWAIWFLLQCYFGFRRFCQFFYVKNGQFGTVYKGCLEIIQFVKNMIP